MKRLQIFFLAICISFANLSLAHNQVTLTGVDPNDIVSFSGGGQANDPNVLLYTVPSDMTFMLTDVVVTGGGGKIVVGGVTKLSMKEDLVHTFKSGVRFNGGEDLYFDPCCYPGGAWVTMSGFLY